MSTYYRYPLCRLDWLFGQQPTATLLIGPEESFSYRVSVPIPVGRGEKSLGSEWNKHSVYAHLHRLPSHGRSPGPKLPHLVLVPSWDVHLVYCLWVKVSGTMYRKLVSHKITLILCVLQRSARSAVLTGVESTARAR